MKRPDSRHYSEEELLMHLLEEEGVEIQQAIGQHLEECQECRAVFLELKELRARLAEWPVAEISEEIWGARKMQVLETVRHFRGSAGRPGYLESLARLLRVAWEFALNNPLPTLGYIIAALAFASERTITVFRLDEILPGTGELFEILRRVL